MAMDDGDVAGRLTEAFTVILHGSRDDVSQKRRVFLPCRAGTRKGGLES
jgi:hypothetical protein